MKFHIKTCMGLTVLAIFGVASFACRVPSWQRADEASEPYEQVIEGTPVYSVLSEMVNPAITKESLARWQEDWRAADADRAGFFPEAVSAEEKDAQFKTAMTHFEKMIEAGLGGHRQVRVRIAEEETVEVFVPLKIYDRIWGVPLGGLSSHHLTIHAVRIGVDSETYLKARTTSLKWQNRAPIVAK